jgi:hypothetical protein
MTLPPTPNKPQVPLLSFSEITLEIWRLDRETQVQAAA